MRRREFLGLIGVGLLCPVTAGAQQRDVVRRIGVLMSVAPDDPEGKARFAAFQQGLQQLGWNDGHNVRIETRWADGKVDNARRYAGELIALGPEVILASGGTMVGPLLQITSTVPIVFTQTPDPVAAGFVASLARPGGNATGFTQVEYGMAAKWLELLKEIAPSVTRVALLRDPTVPEGIGQFTVIQSVAPAHKVDVSPVDIRNAGEIERSLTEFARLPNGGLISLSSASGNVHRDLIIKLAAKLRLPAVYPSRQFASVGGLTAYGSDSIDPHRQAAAYVDRILKGEKPADLPVQAPTKYELIINLKTAKALDLAISAALLNRADEVIE
jgi:putative tryptophan/tyrosine transport system substrate-binding protein